LGSADCHIDRPNLHLTKFAVNDFKANIFKSCDG